MKHKLSLTNVKEGKMLQSFESVFPFISTFLNEEKAFKHIKAQQIMTHIFSPPITKNLQDKEPMLKIPWKKTIHYLFNFIVNNLQKSLPQAALLWLYHQEKYLKKKCSWYREALIEVPPRFTNRPQTILGAANQTKRWVEKRADILPVPERVWNLHGLCYSCRNRRGFSQRPFPVP